MKNKPIVLLCTVPDQECAETIAFSLVESRLAACCNIIKGIQSIYYWQEKVQNDAELLLVIKSTRQQFVKIEAKINELHPYEVPEIIALDISLGSKTYLDWILETTG